MKFWIATAFILISSITMPQCVMAIDFLPVSPGFSSRYTQQPPAFRLFNGKMTTIAKSHFTDSLAKTNSRKWLIGGMHVAAYTGTLMVLNEAWYKDYPRSSFHTFNDSREWLQVDKAGHAWSAYQLGRSSAASWLWAGMNAKQQAWLGAGSGFAFMTTIEILDAFSADWGWSWSDIAANIFGSSLYLTQELGWGSQRISFKYSFHHLRYPDSELVTRADDLYGTGWYERMLKDYNGQTYWLSANLKSFLPKSNLPAWLNIAVGYGAAGMFGAEDNHWEDDNGAIHNRIDINRRREWYLSPDIDFTRIKTNKKWVKTLLFMCNAFKFPAPALSISRGKFRLYGFYF